MNAHIQASQASRDGTVRHVVFAHLSGEVVMTQSQARAFRNLVVVDASYFCGVRVSA